MSRKTPNGSPFDFAVRGSALVVALATVLPGSASGAWQTVISEPGKRVDIERSSVVMDRGGGALARGRIVLDKPIVDPKTSASYRIIEVENRYDCNDRTYATLKRSYFKEEGELLRAEEVKNPYAMPVRSGTPDDRLLREVCKPLSAEEAAAAAKQTAEKVSEAAGDLRKANSAMIEAQVAKEARRAAVRPPAAAPVGTPRRPPARPATSWAYAGEGGPEHWSAISPEFRLCSAGQRQSPIDLRDGIAVDLEAIPFLYRPAAFRVLDAGRYLQLNIYGGGLTLLGKAYELQRVVFHRPAEFTIEGRSFAMEAQLVHRAEDGKLAIVSVLLDPGTGPGAENPVVQAALNNLPLEKGGEVAPPALQLDVERLLPANRRYYTFLGSLTTPPCTEDVLWIVFKQPQSISAEQLAIFQRLYPPNARPLQPMNGRILKESR